ncbi:hypothetical protein M0R45_001660 [Rubus argutus]|uniref:RPW8 domain-containing protein n=1 Tax=Rubus argutus TaxID=59490 RepID=A0AAW1VKI1_RUBAR
MFEAARSKEGSLDRNKYKFSDFGGVVILQVAKGDDALVSVIALLYDAVQDAVNDKIKMFKTVFEDLSFTLGSLQLLVEEDNEKAQHDISDQIPNEKLEIFRKKLQDGVELVRKSSNLSCWGAYKKYNYKKKLVSLEKSLQTLVDILRRLTMRELGKTWTTVENKETMVQEMTYWNTVPEPPSFTVGLDVPLMEVKTKLLEDSMSVLVLTGPGGCGKTTLATKVCQDPDVIEKFRHNIFFLTLAKRPNLSLILQQLNAHKGCQIPNFEDKVSAVRWLRTFLKEEGQKPLLLILDDVWYGSELFVKKFIIEGESKISNYKILVTSRSELPRFKLPKFGSQYHLNLLNEEDAMILFRNSAFLGDKSSYVPEDLLREILKHCKGLPLAIVVVGRSLCGKPIEIWQETLLKWSRGSSLLDSETDLLFTLQSSLDDLGKENYILQECFIDLASFPEDQAIHVPALIDIWAELYTLDEDVMCIANLYELTTRNLVNLVVRRKVEEGYYGEHFVTQHDMLRSLAIHQTRYDLIGQSKRLNINIRGDDLPKWWTEQKEKPKKTHLLSISTDEAFSTKWPIMQLPKAEVLILNFQTKNYVLPKFVENMHKSLKVLIVTNYGSVPAELSNFHLLGSLSKLERIRLHRVSVPSITKKPTHLKSLQKISFFMCNISQAFSKGAIPILHALPNLVEMNIDYCNALVELQEDICYLVHLKKLSVTNCHKLSALPKGIGKLFNLEVLRLRSCTDLVELPGSIGNLKKLNLLDISHCFSVKELPEEIGELGNLRLLNMRDCSRVQELPESFLKLEELREGDM